MITIDDTAAPPRPSADLHDDVVGRAGRLRRRRSAGHAALGAAAVAVAVLVAATSFTGSTKGGVHVTGPAAEGEDAGGMGAADAPAVEPPGSDGGPSSHPDPVAVIAVTAQEAFRKPAGPPSAEPLAKKSAKVLYSRNSGLFEARVDGSEERKLTGEGVYHGRWSPDGKLLVYTHDNDIHVLDMGSGQSTVLYKSTLDQWASYPDWTPDGENIVFVRSTRSGIGSISDLAVIDVATRQTRAVRRLESSLALDIGPDGRILYPCSAKWCLTDASGADLGAMPGSEGWYWPRWSPDGKHIAAIVWIGGEGVQTSGLVVVRADGSDRRVLMDDRAWGALAWLPDGSRVVFNVVPPQPEVIAGPAPCTEPPPCQSDEGIWSMKLDGTDARPIIPEKYASTQDAGAV